MHGAADIDPLLYFLEGGTFRFGQRVYCHCKWDLACISYVGRHNNIFCHLCYKSPRMRRPSYLSDPEELLRFLDSDQSQTSTTRKTKSRRVLCLAPFSRLVLPRRSPGGFSGSLYLRLLHL